MAYLVRAAVTLMLSVVASHPTSRERKLEREGILLGMRHRAAFCYRELQNCQREPEPGRRIANAPLSFNVAQICTSIAGWGSAATSNV